MWKRTLEENNKLEYGMPEGRRKRDDDDDDDPEDGQK